MSLANYAQATNSGGWQWKVIILSALSLSLIDKERLSDCEIDSEGEKEI